MSLRYDERDDLFAESIAPAAPPSPPPFALSAAEAAGVDRLMAEAGLGAIGADGLIEYARRAIAGREYAKFVFTRNLSDALHAMVDWGEHLGLGRDDLAHLELGAMLAPLIDPLFDDADLHYLDLAERGRRAVGMAQTLKLSYLIRDSRDIYVVPLHRSAANFIGSTSVEGRTELLDVQTPASIGLYGKIVCIENADPGYDWIFTKGIKGLVTKYGGVNSHMAIRYAEFGLAAAIGCGERTFERLVPCRPHRAQLRGQDRAPRAGRVRRGPMAISATPLATPAGQANADIDSNRLTRVASIHYYGRSGSIFLQSLLDSHPDVVMLPTVYLCGFHTFWRALRGSQAGGSCGGLRA